MRQPRRLRHRDIDDHQRIERRQRLPHARAVSQRVRGVGALDDHGAQASRMIGQDPSGMTLHGTMPLQQAMAADRRPGIAILADERRELAVQVHAAASREAADQQVHQLLQVRAQRAVRGLLYAGSSWMATPPRALAMRSAT